jgi:hypothetical protein
MAAIGMIAGTLGMIALFEGVAALLEHIEGDPEADVQTALQQLAAKNQRRAMSIIATEQRGKEQVEANFARFNEVPRRALSQAAMLQSGGPAMGRDTGLIDMVAARLGMTPERLGQVSHPSRLGDMSSVIRRMGQSPQ